MYLLRLALPVINKCNKNIAGKVMFNFNKQRQLPQVSINAIMMEEFKFTVETTE